MAPSPNVISLYSSRAIRVIHVCRRCLFGQAVTYDPQRCVVITGKSLVPDSHK